MPTKIDYSSSDSARCIGICERCGNRFCKVCSMAEESGKFCSSYCEEIANEHKPDMGLVGSTNIPWSSVEGCPILRNRHE